MGGHRRDSIAGIVVFLIVLGVLNILADAYIRMPVYLQVVGFLNANLGLLILIAVLFLIGALVVPLNLPAPIVSALGTVFLVRLLLLTGTGFFSVVERALALPVYLLIFIIALVAGYIGLFTGRA